MDHESDGSRPGSPFVDINPPDHSGHSAFEVPSCRVVFLGSRNKETTADTFVRQYNDLKEGFLSEYTSLLTKRNEIEASIEDLDRHSAMLIGDNGMERRAIESPSAVRATAPPSSPPSSPLAVAANSSVKDGNAIIRELQVFLSHAMSGERSPSPTEQQVNDVIAEACSPLTRLDRDVLEEMRLDAVIKVGDYDPEEDALLQEFLCPITQVLPADPVVLKGVVFSKPEIVNWVESHGTHPTSREPCTVKDIECVSHTMKNTIDAIVAAGKASVLQQREVLFRGMVRERVRELLRKSRHDTLQAESKAVLAKIAEVQREMQQETHQLRQGLEDLTNDLKAQENQLRSVGTANEERQHWQAEQAVRAASQRLHLCEELSGAQCRLNDCSRSFGHRLEQLLHRYVSQVVARAIRTNVVSSTSDHCEACGVLYSTLFITSQRHCHRCKKSLCAACCSMSAYDMSWLRPAAPGSVARAVCASCHTECLRARREGYASVIVDPLGVLPSEFFCHDEQRVSATQAYSGGFQSALHELSAVQSAALRSLKESLGWFFASHRLDCESKLVVMFAKSEEEEGRRWFPSEGTLEGAAQCVVHEVVPAVASTVSKITRTTQSLVFGSKEDDTLNLTR